MNIIWQGGAFFKISAQKDRNSTIELAIEPSGKDGSSKGSKIKADIIIEKEGGSGSLNIDGTPFLISNPGEYEIGGVFVQRISHPGGGLLSLIEAEGIKICHFSDKFNLRELDPELIEIIDSTDILMIPIGAQGGLDPKEAITLITEIEPKIVIPMNFKALDAKEKSGDLNNFLKVMGVDNKEEVLKLSIKERDLLTKEGTEVVILSPKS